MKKYIINISLLFFCLHLLAINGFDKSIFSDSHDIKTLSFWGPYTDRYVGISHIPKMKDGIRFDFSVMPGFYRNKQLIPHVLYESGYYPWMIDSDVKNITYRYELQWKDRVYTDVTYYILNENKVLVEMNCVNNSDLYQNLSLNLMAYINYKKEKSRIYAENSENIQWIEAVDYDYNEPEIKTPQYALVYDGAWRNEEISYESISNTVIGKKFGETKGDRIGYTLDINKDNSEGYIVFRHKTPKGAVASFAIDGLVKDTVSLKGYGEFVFTSIPYSTEKLGKMKLELKSLGTSATTLDGFFLSKCGDSNNFVVKRDKDSFIPKIEEGKYDFILKYPNVEEYYGVAWHDSLSSIREILDDKLEAYFVKKTHDHVSKRLVGNSKWHYTNAFIRPIVVEPQSSKKLYAIVCCGTYDQVKKDVSDFHVNRNIKSLENRFTVNCYREGEKYSLSLQLLQASLLSNILYPIYTQGEFIRHFTPGKNWNSLYTWDSGFIAEGLIDIDNVKAFECLRAYTTPLNSESAFIHHGTPLPIQIFAYLDLWNRTESEEMLEFLYFRFKQLFEFMVGINPHSTTRIPSTGLLKTWDYFYNSGGWDDYPPQKALNGDRKVTPVVTSAYYIRAAKILRMVADRLELNKDVRMYDRMIKQLSSSLLKYSWDEESGYFGYVVHDDNGNAIDIYRYNDGSNFNKGLDGVSPLVANISDDSQNERMISNLFSTEKLWTDVGLSTVDQSAPYYRSDGYWNGAVWFPHQWLIWKALLDQGEGNKAYKLANKALDTWNKECNESYYTFEHFIISSGRGAGWHQFSGLSSPIINWFNSYYVIGKVSTGFEIFIEKSSFNDDYTYYESYISFDESSRPNSRIIILCMNPDYSYRVKFNNVILIPRVRIPGLLEISLPKTNKSGNLIIEKI